MTETLEERCEIEFGENACETKTKSKIGKILVLRGEGGYFFFVFFLFGITIAHPTTPIPIAIVHHFLPTLLTSCLLSSFFLAPIANVGSWFLLSLMYSIAPHAQHNFNTQRKENTHTHLLIMSSITTWRPRRRNSSKVMANQKIRNSSSWKKGCYSEGFKKLLFRLFLHIILVWRGCC